MVNGQVREKESINELYHRHMTSASPLLSFKCCFMSQTNSVVSFSHMFIHESEIS